MFALTVSVMLQIMALVFAPAMLSIMTQFFLPIQNQRIACSDALLSIGTSPSYKRYRSTTPDSDTPEMSIPA